MKLIIQRSDVIVILVVFGLFYFVAAKQKPYDLRNINAEKQIKIISQELEKFRSDTNRFPTTSEGLSALVTNPGVAGWHGPYIQNNTQYTIVDPWGRPFLYESPGKHGAFDLYSYGKDGSPGGWGHNADIKSWELRP